MVEKIIVEVCCGSYYDAKQAYLGKADRIELNSSLHLGGITPSIANLILVKEKLNIKTICMVRNRGAGFLYNQEDIKTMLLDAKLLLQNKADGIAFGFLDENQNIDLNNTKKMVDIIKSMGKEVVFHRAFDCTKEPEKSIEILINLGVDRVLTSGLKDKAIDGINIIKKLNKTYGEDIEIIAGSGINHTNAKMILKETGIKQVHSSCKDYIQDKTTVGKDVNYAYLPDKFCYDVVSKQLVEKLVESVKA